MQGGECLDIYISSSIEDAINQLKILGTSDFFELKTNRFLSKQLNEDINNILTNHQDLFDKYKDIIHDSDTSLTKNKVKAHLQIFETELRNCIETVENLKKTNKDRKFIEHFLEELKGEITSSQTFSKLENAVQQEKLQRRQTVESLEEHAVNKGEIKRLTKIISEFKKERESELQIKNEIIAHLKDKIQELKAKSSMEQKYIDKMCNLEMAKAHSLADLKEKNFVGNIHRVRRKRENEERCTSEITNFVQRQIEVLNQKSEEWAARYDSHVEEKQKELDEMKNMKAFNKKQLERLKIMCYDHRHIIGSYKYETNKTEYEQTMDMDLNTAAQTIQSWFRGVILRHGLVAVGKKKGKKKAAK